MSTMTLEQVRDALRSIEGSKAGAFGGYYLSENAIKTWADAIDAHLHSSEERSKYFADGPEGYFFADDYALAEKMIAGAGFDRDEWTITNTGDKA